MSMRAKRAVPVMMSGGAAATYADKVLGYSPFIYYPMDETSGTTIDNAEGTAGLDGTASNVTLAAMTGPDGGDAPSFNGTSSKIDIPTSPLVSALNGNNYSVQIWFKVASGGWTDGVGRYLFSLFGGTDSLIVERKTTNDQINVIVKHEGTQKVATYTIASPTETWYHILVSVDGGGDDDYFVYLNGAQVGTNTGIGVLTPSYTTTVISGQGTVVEWSGGLAHFAMFNSALNAAAASDLATV